MRKRTFFTFLLLGLFLGASFLFLKAHAVNEKAIGDDCPTYFHYSSGELEELKGLNSEQTITEEELIKWDRITKEFLNQEKITDLEKLRLFSYLYEAQRDAAFLSYSLKNHFEGSLEPLNRKIIQLFYPGFTQNEITTDAYSEKLAAVVGAKLEKKFQDEGNLSKLLKGSEKEYSQWIPWIALPSFLYFPPPINSDILPREAEEIKKMERKFTPQQKERYQFWLGTDHRETANWISIANDYIFQPDLNIPLGKVILIRNLLTFALYDTTIAVLESKSLYKIPRPNIFDSTIKAKVIETDFSYPSGHAAAAASSCTVLSYFFPEDKKYFSKLVEEAGKSRIYAGVHYPIDLIGGQRVGEKVAFEVLLYEKQTEETPQEVHLQKKASKNRFRLIKR